MVKVDEAFQLKYTKAKENFELLVDFNKLQKYKKQQQKLQNNKQIKTPIQIDEILADDKIFKNQKKGELANQTELETHFQTTNTNEILKQIILKGECQIPTAYKNKLREEKKRQIINYISENATNPQTKTKYAQTLIENEINKIKYNYNPEQDYITQANEILKHLKKIMPITITKCKIQIRIPGLHCGNFYGKFRKYGKILKEKFDDNGNLCMELEISESIIYEITEYIKQNSNSKGEYVVLNEQ